MRRIFSLFSSNRIATDHSADRVTEVLETLTFKEWLFSTLAAAVVTIVFPLLILLIDVREAWLP